MAVVVSVPAMATISEYFVMSKDNYSCYVIPHVTD